MDPCTMWTRSSANVGWSIPEADLPAVLARCRADPSALEALREVYASADRAVARARLVCLGGGVCCRFDLFGHRLYVSTLELAELTSRRPPAPRPAGPDRCLYQVGPDCTARARRPLGCRIFFCREEKKAVLARLHERLHRRLRGIHSRHCIPYAYAEVGAGVSQSFM